MVAAFDRQFRSPLTPLSSDPNLAMKTLSRPHIFSLANHALRAPIANICGHAQILQDLPLDPAQRARSLSALRCGAETSLLLIDRWFEAMRAMAPGATAPAPPRDEAPFSLSSLMRDAVRSRDRLARRHGLRVDIVQRDRGHGADPRLRLDRESVESALTCLLDAARLQLPPGAVLTIGCESLARVATVRLARADDDALFAPTLRRALIEEAIALDRGLGVSFHLTLAAHLAARVAGDLELDRQSARIAFPL